MDSRSQSSLARNNVLLAILLSVGQVKDKHVIIIVIIIFNEMVVSQLREKATKVYVPLFSASHVLNCLRRDRKKNVLSTPAVKKEKYAHKDGNMCISQ